MVSVVSTHFQKLKPTRGTPKLPPSDWLDKGIARAHKKCKVKDPEKKENMKLTSGAIKALARGAGKGDEDVNAVTEDGKELMAGQVCCEDDEELREMMDLDEYQPVLRVTKMEWLGFWGCVPTIKWHVTDRDEEDDGDDDEEDGGDGDTDMVMFTSHRSFKIAKNFFKKWGDPKRGKLGVGARFMLVDYTTAFEPKDKFHDKDGPVLRVERIRCEPKTHRQSSMLAWLRRNKMEKELEFKV